MEMTRGITRGITRGDLANKLCLINYAQRGGQKTIHIFLGVVSTMHIGDHGSPHTPVFVVLSMISASL